MRENEMSDFLMRILLIEDDDADAMMFERSIRCCNGNYKCHHSPTIENALSWLSEEECDVILLDLSLPDSEGLDSIRSIHAQEPDCPIVMLTGLDDDTMALDALEQGAQDYLVKGETSSRELERTLRHAIQRQQIQNENRRLLLQLQLAARSDALTGVLNRHAMIEEFEKHWSNASAGPLACVILDVDYFKKINDRFGHLAGDEVLCKVAKLISSLTRPGDCLARYGGEEFCAVLAGANEQQAVDWAERARLALRSHQFDFLGQLITVTASFGVAQRTVDMDSIEELIDQADQALMIGKNTGRDRVFSFHASDTAIPRERVAAVATAEQV